jgi:hypothetical protein
VLNDRNDDHLERGGGLAAIVALHGMLVELKEMRQNLQFLWHLQHENTKTK